MQEGRKESCLAYAWQDTRTGRFVGSSLPLRFHGTLFSGLACCALAGTCTEARACLHRSQSPWMTNTTDQTHHQQPSFRLPLSSTTANITRSTYLPQLVTTDPSLHARQRLNQLSNSCMGLDLNAQMSTHPFMHPSVSVHFYIPFFTFLKSTDPGIRSVGLAKKCHAARQFWSENGPKTVNNGPNQSKNRFRG